MRHFWALFVSVTFIVVAAGSCGSGGGTNSSHFTDTTGTVTSTGSGMTSSTGTLTGSGGSGNPDGGPCPGQVTCASANAACGQIPDGCGALLDCGSCPAGETCGGGGTNNVCAPN